MKISALVAVKPDNGWRDKIWEKVRKRYETLMPDLELCVVCDKSEPFWKTRALNEAAQRATGDVFLLADADVVFHPNLLKKIEAVIPKHPWVIPFTEGLRLTEAATRKLLQKDIKEDVKIDPKDIHENDVTPGVLLNAMTRSCFEAVGGLDERFRGWGHEDSALVIALDTLYGRHHRIQGRIFHLWHRHASRAYSEKNRNLLQEYNKAKKSLVKMRKLINERYYGFDSFGR